MCKKASIYVYKRFGFRDRKEKYGFDSICCIAYDLMNEVRKKGGKQKPTKFVKKAKS